MIVDAHAHLGLDQVFDEDFTAAKLVASQERNGIDVTLVQPGTAHDLDTVRRYHDAIADLAAEHPGHFFGIANPNPHLTGDAYEREVERCVRELGFVGIKLHPTAHAADPGGRDGHRVFATAAALGVPLMVHTGQGIPWAAPALLDPLAVEFPDLTIVVAHAGGGIFAAEAGQLAARRAKIYLECSWTAGFVVRRWCDELGADRLMFGSDHAENAAAELGKLRTADLADADLTMVLGGTARQVFGLEGAGA